MACALWLVGAAGADARATEARSHMVMLEDWVESPAAVAAEHAAHHRAEIVNVYGAAVKGYSAKLTPAAVEAIGEDFRVAVVERDSPLTRFGHTTENHQLERTFAPSNPNIDIDGIDDARVDADVAILDEGVFDYSGTPWHHLTHADSVDCMHPREGDESYVAPDAWDPNWRPADRLNEPNEDLPYGCLDGYVHTDTDAHHGTAVADKAVGRDGGAGAVGTGPGARVHGVRMMANGYPSMEHLIAAVDWVTATRMDSDPDNDITVATMALGCRAVWQGPGPDPYPNRPNPPCDHSVLDVALAESVAQGVVYVAAGGNKPEDLIDERLDTSLLSPANHPDVITASNMADFDGLPGGLAPDDEQCGGDGPQPDDVLDKDSFSGLGIELAGPTPCGGTSGATALIAGAAAVLTSQCKPTSREGVRFITDTLVAEGNYDWTDNSGDGRHEPLLDMSNTEVFDPVMVGEQMPADGCDWRSRPAESDVDGDGRSDLVTLDSSGGLKMFNGRFSGIDASSATSAGSLDPALLDRVGHYVIDVADVTGDGKSDLFSANTQGGLVVRAGREDGTFETTGVTSYPTVATVYNGSGSSEAIAAADVNNDGRADGIGFNHATGAVTVIGGQADGSFSGVASTSIQGDSALLDGSGHYFLDAADVTGDDRADLVSMHSSGTVYVHAGQADSTFAAATAAASVDTALDDGVGQEPVGVGDVNADGRADLVTLAGQTLKLRLGQSDGTFAAATEPYAGSVDSNLLDGTGVELVGLLDYSRDGFADLVAIDADGDVRTYTANRDATFAAPSTSAGSVDSIRRRATGHEAASSRPLIARPGCVPSGCDWPPAMGIGGSADGAGMFIPGDGTWNLRDMLSAGPATSSFVFHWGTTGDFPMTGDWDGDGDDTIGMFRPSDGTWNLRNSNSAGAADISFAYNWGAAWDVPVVGDWDGDGDDTIGMYRPGDGTWNLRNTNSSGATDISFAYTWNDLSDIPVVGDWDGDGDDTIGMFRPSNGTWNLRNTNSAGAADISFAYNWGAAWDVPVTGDWDGDGDDTIGMYRPGDPGWNLRNTNSSGAIDISFGSGSTNTNDIPVVGNWDGG